MAGCFQNTHVTNLPVEMFYQVVHCCSSKSSLGSGTILKEGKEDCKSIRRQLITRKQRFVSTTEQ